MARKLIHYPLLFMKFVAKASRARQDKAREGRRPEPRLLRGEERRASATQSWRDPGALAAEIHE
ncbi:MAG: hypothetical protein HQL51_05440 [Magnetococcales bacterium]|nr:hypothetical protein [Magnetococcales bacterium]